jgi:hypothetical protein
MQTSTPTPATDTAADTGSTSPFLAALDAMIEDYAGQCLLSQARCVDRLLDLYNLTADPIVRTTVVFALDQIRQVTAVRATEMIDRLRLVAAVAEIEAAFAPAA